MPTKTATVELEPGSLSDPQMVGQRRDWFEIAVIAAISVLSVLVGHQLEANSMGERTFAMAGIMLTLVAVLVFHRRRGDGWGALGMSRPRSWMKTVLIALASLVVLVVVLGFFQALVVLPMTAGAEADISRFDSLRGNFPRFLLALLSAWVSGAFAEEVVYRGFLIGRLAKILGGGRWAWWGSVVFSAVLFGILHLYQGPAGVLMTGFTGLLIGAVYILFKRNLWICVLVHGLMHVMSFTAVYLGAIS